MVKIVAWANMAVAGLKQLGFTQNADPGFSIFTVVARPLISLWKSFFGAT
ncbi:MAG: hypothetical protein WB586_05970 [Chthoniobacterales bacterium]